MPRSEGSPPQQDVPKLTLSQRILAALPSLQREKPAPSRNGADVVRPDAVIEADGVDGVGGDEAGSNGRSRPSGTAQAKPVGTTQAATARSRPDAYPDMTLDELRGAMRHLDPRERTVAMFLGPLLAALDLALMQVTLHDNPALGHKNHADPSSIVALGVGSAVLALVVLAAAFYRRRSFTIFALLFAGYGGGLVTMIPAWVAAGWLFIHFNRYQKAVVARTGGPAAARQRAAQARADRNTNRPKLGSRRSKTPEPTGPAQNKRYTPPKAPGAR